ncbi:MAG TPA: hypothetical protein VH353_01370 [Caulobacteraceae bacterium]|nr:hypothetical protein [Caulobacteraceae bacterium]
MAEGVLGGVLGGDEEDREASALGEVRPGAEAFAAALAADQAKYDLGVARAAEAFLNAQTAELSEQRALRLRHLHNQSRESKLRRVGQRIRLGMQVITGLVLGLIGLGVLVMLYDAFTSRSVVVDAFKAPSALTSRGLTGDVVASGVLDTLQKLQDATRAADKGLSSKGAWGSDVKIEVPETGVSIGEIDRLLHVRFGHDLHIDGDLVQTETGGLALTVRGDGVPARTFTSGPGDLDKLTAQAAEYVYGRSQPLQYATYLEDANRYADALAFLPAAFARAISGEDRAKLANLWGNAYSGLYQPARALEKHRLSVTLSNPYSERWWITWGDIVGDVQYALGEEAAWRESEALLRASTNAPKRERPPLRVLSNPAQVVWDLPLLLASNLEDARAHGGAGTSATILGPQIADTYDLMHDPQMAARYIASSDPDDPLTKAESLLLAGYAALDRTDTAAAIPPLEAFYKAWLADPNLQFTYADNACFLGLAYGLAGRAADAEAVFRRGGPWSRCYALHGDVLARTGDAAGAQRVWAEGLKLAPDLPMIYLHRGLFEMSRGDLQAAGADLDAANAKAPHFADPLKARGDLLMREGRWKGALANYDEALKYAPAWAELRRARAAGGRRAQATP